MLNKLFGLKGKTAMVIGGAGGLGAAQVRALAGAGADVLVADLSEEAGEGMAAEVLRSGRRAAYVPIDISDKASVLQATEKAMEQFGRIDILCNTAGVNYRVPLLEYPEEEWDRVMDINLKGLYLTSQAVVPQMIERGSGKVINMSSIMGRITYYHQAAYCASKGGVDALTRVMALEWAKSGVQVNAISPTYIRTPLVEEMLKKEPERVEFIEQRTPLGRLGLTKEIMGLTIFLASPASDLMTGQSVCLDGGWTIF